MFQKACYSRNKGHCFADVCRLRKQKRKMLSSIELHAVGAPAMAKLVNVTVDNCTGEFKVNSTADVLILPSNLSTVPCKVDMVDRQLTGPLRSVVARVGILLGKTAAAGESKLPSALCRQVAFRAFSGFLNNQRLSRSSDLFAVRRIQNKKFTQNCSPDLVD